MKPINIYLINSPENIVFRYIYIQKDDEKKK